VYSKSSECSASLIVCHNNRRLFRPALKPFVSRGGGSATAATAFNISFKPRPSHPLNHGPIVSSHSLAKQTEPILWKALVEWVPFETLSLEDSHSSSDLEILVILKHAFCFETGPFETFCWQLRARC